MAGQGGLTIPREDLHTARISTESISYSAVCKVADIGPDSEGQSFEAKVVHCAVSVARETTRGADRAADVLIGDESGCVLLTAVGGQVDILQPGTSVSIKNARVSCVPQGCDDELCHSKLRGRDVHIPRITQLCARCFVNRIFDSCAKV